MDAEKTWAEILSQIGAVLDYKLFELDGNGVSVAKLLTGLTLLIVGYWLSGRAARTVDERVLARLQMEASLRYTFRRFLFYVFLFITTMFTLRTLNVPITIFTVIGGALAVGIGFGSQNLVNNFISGILVMVERPIRVGDFVEVDGISGHVTSIGIRSTVLVTLTNAAVIVPNTAFIEKNLINWTRQSHVGSRVTIGVSYGSDPEVVQRILLEAASSVDEVLAHPEPTVAFSDFGDNALIFDLFFSVSSETFPFRRRIESQIRFRLHGLLAQNGISVPFPQRDVHLDVSAPLSVKVLN